MRGHLLIIFICLSSNAYCQLYLDDLKKFKQLQVSANKTLDSLRKTDQNKTLKLTKRKIKDSKKQWLSQINRQIKQLDTVFKAYKRTKGFDFNTADTVLLIYQTDIQSNLNSYLIISANDTINFIERWRMLGLHTYEREIVYEPFLDTTNYKGLIVTDARDSLLTLASKNDYSTAQKLAKENPCSDGSTSTIIFARKEKNRYHFEYCFLQPFILMPVWRTK